MDTSLLLGIYTALVLVLFLGIWAWAWSRKRREDFEEAARLPLEDDTHTNGSRHE